VTFRYCFATKEKCEDFSLVLRERNTNFEIFGNLLVLFCIPFNQRNSSACEMIEENRRLLAAHHRKRIIENFTSITKEYEAVKKLA